MVVTDTAYTGLKNEKIQGVLIATEQWTTPNILCSCTTDGGVVTTQGTVGDLQGEMELDTIIGIMLQNRVEWNASKGFVSKVVAVR